MTNPFPTIGRIRAGILFNASSGAKDNNKATINENPTTSPPSKPSTAFSRIIICIPADNCEALRKTGWNIITVWECQLKPRKREQTLEGILLLLQKIYLDLQKKPIITPYTPPATEFPIVAEPPSPYGDD